MLPLLTVTSSLYSAPPQLRVHSSGQVLVSLRAPSWMALAWGTDGPPALTFDWKALLRRAALIAASAVLLLAVWLHRDVQKSNHE